MKMLIIAGLPGLLIIGEFSSPFLHATFLFSVELEERYLDVESKETTPKRHPLGGIIISVLSLVFSMGSC